MKVDEYLKKHKLQLVQTCAVCPEQYDVFLRGYRAFGYLRLRHGWFRASFPDVGGVTVYEAGTVGDGMFHDEEEREFHIKKALKKLRKEAKKQKLRF